MTALVGVRVQLKGAAEAHGTSLSYMPFFIKAASLALTHYPIINSSVDDKCENITYKVCRGCLSGLVICFVVILLQVPHMNLFSHLGIYVGFTSCFVSVSHLVR